MGEGRERDGEAQCALSGSRGRGGSSHKQMPLSRTTCQKGQDGNAGGSAGLQERLNWQVEEQRGQPQPGRQGRGLQRETEAMQWPRGDESPGP